MRQREDEEPGHAGVVAALFGAPPARLDTATLAAARRHKVDLLLFSRLLRERPEALTGGRRAEAAETLRTAAAGNRRLLGELLRVLARLDAASIPALPLKGPALALLLHDDLSVRRFQDLDVLVPEERVDDALRVLRAIGYRAPPNGPGLGREIHLMHEARKLVVDLHWNVVDRRMPFALDVAAIWAERRLILGQATLPVPPPEWLVVASCLYLIKEHPRPGLLYLVDLQRLLARFPDLGWDRVAAIAAATGMRRICALGLALVSELAGTALPAPAREHFAADRATRAAAARVRRALGAEEHEEWGSRPYQRYLHRLLNTMAHASFRERPMDRMRVYLSLGPLFFPWSASQWRQRVRHGPAIAASLVRGAVRSFFPQSRSLLHVGRIRPAPGTSFHPLDDAGVLFAGATQELHALSPSATFFWCCLAEGLSPRRAARLYADACGRSRAEARADVAALLGTLRAIGVLGSGPTEVPPPPTGAAAPQAGRDIGAPAPVAHPPTAAPADVPVRRRYRLLGSVFELGFGGEALCRAVDPALRHLATAARPDATIAVIADAHGFSVLIDGQELERCGSIEVLAPTVKGGLNAAAVNRRDFAFYLHAAMLRRGGAALLLPAAPGAGKTCLAAALSRTGFAYHTDEITLLERTTFAARGAPVALTVKDGGWPVLEPLYPEIAGLPTHLRVDRQTVRYLPPPVDASDPALEQPWPVRWIVFPRYTPEGPCGIERVPRVDALRLLFDECLALRLTLDAEQIQALVDWIAGIECHALAFNDLRTAVRLIEEVCGTR